MEYIRGIGGSGVRSRDIIVWLPPGYFTNKKEYYPVLYMHDGQNIFDPATCGFGYDWQVDERADSLIRYNIINPVIIVGMYNTPARRIEYSPNDSGEAYMRYVVNVVKPLIDKTYRTKPEREFTAVAGSSMGGLISFMMGWQYDSVFSKAGCFSAALQIYQFNYVPFVNKTKERKNTFFYIDNGGLGLEQKLQTGIDAMLVALRTKGYSEGKDFVFIKDETAEHNEIAWSKRIGKVLEMFYGRK